jgi:hypothetical protein
MNRGVTIGLLAALFAGSTVQAQAPLPTPTPTPAPRDAGIVAEATDTSGPAPARLYGDAEYLLWWMRGVSLPPLVTTSPPGTAMSRAGLLGNPGTMVLFGQSTENEEARSGMRFTIGAWVDNNSNLGVEGNFLLLEAKAARFAASSNGTPILARPFVNALTGQPDAERVAFPGDVAGSIAATATTDGLIGAGFLVRYGLTRDNSFRLDALVGYRYLRFAERLSVAESLTSVNPNSPEFILAGTRIVVADNFGTKDVFNGVDLGLEARFESGGLGLGVLTKVAAGPREQAVDITGSTMVTVPGTAPSTSPGGLLALASNLGHHSRVDGAVIPELDTNLSYRFTPRIRATIGYSLLYWPAIARVGDEVDLRVNPNLLPKSTTPPTGPPNPVFSYQQSHFLAQGLSFGLEFSY